MLSKWQISSPRLFVYAEIWPLFLNLGPRTLLTSDGHKCITTAGHTRLLRFARMTPVRRDAGALLVFFSAITHFLLE